MKPENALSRINAKTRRMIQATIFLFIVLLLAVSVFIGKEFIWSNYTVTEGEISQYDIFAPFDFSFVDIDGEVIEVKKNELVIQRGEKVSKTQELAAKKLEIMQMQPKNIYYFFGIMLLLIILAVLIVAYVTVYVPEAVFVLKNIVLLCVLSLLIVICTKAMLLSFWSVYLIPLAGVSMLVAILIDPGVALMFTVVLSVFIGVLTGIRYDVMFTLLVGGFVGVYAVLNVRHRRNLTKAGLLVSLTNMVSIVSMGVINFVPINHLVIQSGWGLANGIVSAIVVTGVLPIFEMLFGISTNITLLELSDLNQPVLKEMVLKAPGTYHHSLLVGNLAESAAEAVGANSLLARVGAYFHDIGKLRMAPYFSENQQQTENKHDNLSPTISSLVIINHIKEGADLAKKYRLGKAIQDIIIQHHGDDVVHYFYHRALERHSPEDGKVEAEDFRYPGPKPQSKEAAIVMLADSVEAASRAMQQPTPAKIQDIVNRIINNKFIDGQLNECDLTLKDLHVISEVFAHILNGIFHTRVEYPDAKQSNNEQNKNKESSEKSKNKPAKT
ncbi:MAG: HDIG domain-containing protein [Candidatus Omnitrophica bacterium]|nr:HDIG domain-containing protein [Candidatus Omnitrophota bacterium]MBU4477694.1 HDIG domain-containing protein [Candidatus Omnitrophota bacterium]MCG2703891.1 HDIG domain-containing protein [Candidatus Omnitrophota bacterium]